MTKTNWPLVGIGGAVALGAVAYFAHRIGYAQAYKEATTNCQSMLALNTPVALPTASASEISGLFGRF